MAAAIRAAPIPRKPDGSPRLRSVIEVPPDFASCQEYVVSIGKGPSAVLMRRLLPGECSRTSYVYESRLPRNCATNANRDPTLRGRGVFHSTDLMFSYQSGALSGSATYPATSSRGRSILISVLTSTGTTPTFAPPVMGTRQGWGSSSRACKPVRLGGRGCPSVPLLEEWRLVDVERQTRFPTST